MKVSRRNFLKYCVGSAAALGLDLSMLGALEKALATGGGPPIVWLAGANCTGCTVSLANLVGTSAPVDVADLLVNTINLAYHPNLMGPAGDQAVGILRETTRGDFVLVVEGGIPTAFGGHTCMLWTQNDNEITAKSAVGRLAPAAKAVVCVGACSSYGGIPGGQPNPTRIKSVSELTGVATVNIPGCPAHPDWIVWTVAQLLGGARLSLDSSGRPTSLFGSRVHDRCPRRDRNWAAGFGQDDLCLRDLGCKGPNTRADCPTRQWNNQTNWCVGANSICLGCTERGFPDRFSPFYSSAGALPSDHPQTTQSCSSCHGPGGPDDD